MWEKVLCALLGAAIVLIWKRIRSRPRRQSDSLSALEQDNRLLIVALANQGFDVPGYLALQENRLLRAALLEKGQDADQVLAAAHQRLAFLPMSAPEHHWWRALVWSVFWLSLLALPMAALAI